MSFARIASRVAVGGVSAALATAGLVGVTSTSASAASATSTYTCSVPTMGDKTFTVSVDIPLLPPTAPAGAPVTASLLSFKSVLTVPADVAVALGDLGVNGAKSDDFSTAVGPVVAKAPVVWNTPGAPNPDTTVPFSGTGSNAAFVLPKAGTYSVNMPKTFSLTPTNNGAALPFSAPCTSATPATIGTLTLSKQVATVKAKASPKKVKHGSTVSVKGKVSNEYQKTGGPAATGKVVIKDGKKKVGTATIKKGKFVVKLKGLAVGSHTLTANYKGDGYTAKGVSKELEVTVTK